MKDMQAAQAATVRTTWDEALARERILILDGAIGTMLQAAGLTEDDFRAGPLAGCPVELRGNNECLNLTRPDVVRAVHEAYIEAGADIITTNTFGANAIVQHDYGCAELAPRMALAGARLARAAADAAGRPVLVAGSVGPTSKSLTLSPSADDPTARTVGFDEMAAAYAAQMRALLLGGADVLLLETCFDALNVKAALYALMGLADDPAARRELHLTERFGPDGLPPVIVSATVSDRSGRTLTGQTLEAFYAAVSHYPLAAFGLNCSLGADEMYPLVSEVAAFASCPVSCHPNAGLPDGLGGYGETPEAMARAMGRMAADALLDIAGGCCGSTPAHVRAIAEAVAGCRPRRCLRPVADASPGCLVVSGLEAVGIDLGTRRFTNVGERTNVAGSRKFARTVAAGDMAGALQIAAAQIENGADVIDVNMDDAMLDSRTEMERFVRAAMGEPAVARAALMIDSSHWDTLLAGLKNAQGKCIVNSLSLKDGEEAFLRRAREVRRLGAAMVVMAFDEKGQATDLARKTEICARAYRLLTERAGVAPHDIIFDANILAVGTGIAAHARYAVDFLDAVRWIKANLPGALTSGGVSNLSFAFRGNNAVRGAMHAAFLYHAVRAGLDMAIVNPAMLLVYDEVEPHLLRAVEDVLFATDDDATARLVELAARVAEARDGAAGAARTAAADATPAAPATPEERLAEALVRGRTDTLAADVDACLRAGATAVGLVEGPLMEGMKRVGTLFADGKMFLPQVVKSAKVMKQAVALLEPHMQADGPADGTTGEDGNAKPRRPRAVIATVKGDVHDIGKNIVAIVLGCNGFDVRDLGVMVAKETILDEAAAWGADIVMASGLITPSLFHMEELCREMTRRGLSVPLFIGGATTSALHTAVKLAPLYAHVFYGADASATAVMAKRCLAGREAFEREARAAQERLRAQYAAGRPAAQGAGEPGEGRPYPPKACWRHEAPANVEAADVPLGLLRPLFDWTLFYAIWGVKQGQTSPHDPALLALRREAEALLDRYEADGTCHVRMGVRWLPATAEGDDLCLRLPDGSVRRLPMLRQERPSTLADGRRACLSLADYVPRATDGFASPVGFFAVSVDDGTPRHAAPQAGAAPGDAADYDGLLRHAVRSTLAEAASEWLGQTVHATVDDACHRNGDAAGGWRVVRPAAGYAACPDHTLKRDILGLLPGAARLGISLTESCAMLPEASVCGLVLVHREAGYPELRALSSAQLDSYARRRGMTPDEARRFLGHLRA